MSTDHETKITPQHSSEIPEHVIRAAVRASAVRLGWEDDDQIEYLDETLRAAAPLLVQAGREAQRQTTGRLLDALAGVTEDMRVRAAYRDAARIARGGTQEENGS